MSFINTFNYKKYFRKESDATVARVGHVNRLAERFLDPEYVTQETDNETDVTINSYVGQVTMASPLSAPGDFTVYNSKVSENSVILVSIIYSNVGDRNDLVFSAPLNIQNGSFDIAWTVSTPTLGPIKFNFIILS